MSDMLSIAETCALLGVCRQTLTVYMRRGLPHFKAPGRKGAVRISRKKLDAWMEKRTKTR